MPQDYKVDVIHSQMIQSFVTNENESVSFSSMSHLWLCSSPVQWISIWLNESFHNDSVITENRKAGLATLANASDEQGVAIMVMIAYDIVFADK